MIRLCGSHTLRAYLGYEHEARANAALEVTAVNCGGVHAELVDGFITRSTSPDPPSKTIAVALLQGDSEDTITASLQQIHACSTFELAKAAKGCPDGTGDVNWCFRIVYPNINTQSANAAVNVITKAWAIDDDSAIHRIAMALTHPPFLQSASPNPVKNDSTTPVMSPSSPKHQETPPEHKNGIKLSSFELPTPFKATFFCTFEGLSELSASPAKSKLVTFVIASLSAMSMLAIQVLCFWQEGWQSAGWILVIVGYSGMVTGVVGAAYLIYSSCDAVSMAVQRKSKDAGWVYGVALVVKNTDSLDTTGSRLLNSGETSVGFEAVWLKRQSPLRHLLAWTNAIFLSLSFVCHYLGLRSSKWWLSVTELLICLIAAFGRSMNKTEQNEFHVVDDVLLDKRCYSTGILDMQRASRIDKEQRDCRILDLRVYSVQATGCLPLTGEFIAWRAAKICLKDTVIADRILSITGMIVAISQSPGSLERKLVVAYDGGAITEQGIAFPNARICLSFPSSLEDIAAPTPLLARGMMRQPQWSLEHLEVKKDTLPFIGGIYISSFDSMLTWWTVAEDRNEMGDQHKNLHGSLLLINMAFFICVQRSYSDDVELIAAIDDAHQNSNEEDGKFAENLVEFLGGLL